MLTVVTFAYGRNYTLWHAQNLRTMLEKSLTIPWRLKIITDAVHEFTVAGFDAVKMWDVNAALRQRNRPSGHTFARLALFDKHIGGSLGDRLLYLPLDCIIRGNIDDLIPVDDTPVKVTRFMGNEAITGGLMYIVPGAVNPCPWKTVQLDPDFPRRVRFGDTANGVLSHMLGTAAHAWSEFDGVIADRMIDAHLGWRVFIRTGNSHVWTHGQPEQPEYLSACDLLSFEPQIGNPAAAPEPREKTELTVRPANRLLRGMKRV
jgi:hypothetical protein